MKRYIHIIFACFAIAFMVMAPLGTNIALAADNPASTDQTNLASFKSCISFTLGVPTGIDFTECAAALSYNFLWFMSWLIWMAGILLNRTIEYTILDMRSNLNNIAGIGAAWSAIRDLVNMTFIFILLYTAVKTVLQIGNTNWQNVVKNLIIVALLINFSMFFTKLVIDASNIVTVGIYNGITSSVGIGASNAYDKGLSQAIVRPLGITTLFDEEAGKALRASGPIAMIINGIMGGVLIIIAAFILLVMSFMLWIRYVVLILVIILSPFAFAGYILPELGGQARQWRTSLINQATFAPLFMIMLWVALRIMNETKSITAARLANLGNVRNVTAMKEAVGLVVDYGIFIIFLVSTIVIAKMAATKGGGYLSSTMGKANGWAGATLFGTGAFLGRQTAGRIGKDISDSESLQRLASKGGWKGRVGNIGLWSGKKIASGSYDARSSRVGGALTKELGGAGTPSKPGGYAKIVEDNKKKSEQRKKEQDALKRKFAVKDSISAGTKASEELATLNATIAQQGGTITDEQTAQKNDLELKITAMNKTLQTLNDKGVEDLGKDNLKNKAVAQSLTSQKFAAAMKSEKWSDKEKEDMMNARYGDTYKAVDDLETMVKAHKTLVAGGTALTAAQTDAQRKLEEKVGQQMAKISSQDLEFIKSEYYAKPEFASNVQRNVYTTVMKPDNQQLTPSQKQKFAEAYIAPAKAKMTPGPGYDAGEAARAMSGLNPDDVANLDIPQLTNPDVVETYKKEKLEKMARKLDRPKREAIRNAIITHGARPGASKNDTTLANWITTGAGSRIYS